MWYTLAIISALFSATAAILEKKTLFNTKALNFSFILAVFNVILSIPFLFFINYNAITANSVLVLYGKTVLGAFSFLLVMLAIKNLQISDALPLLVLTPGLVAFLAFVFLNEKLNLPELLGMILLLSGTYALQLKNKNLLQPFKTAFRNEGYFYVTGAVLLFATTSILDKALLANYKLQPEAFLPIQHLFLAINFSVMLLVSKQNNSTTRIEFRKAWKIILLISVITIVYRYAHIWAVKLGAVALVLSIKRTSVFFAIVIGGRYFKDQGLVRKSIATLVMIAGAILIILNLKT